MRTIDRVDRRTIIGASEAAAIMGLSPFSTPLDVYWRKVGDLVEEAPTPAMLSGTRLEPVILQYCSDRLGVKLQVDVETRVDPVSGILAATPDALVRGVPQGVEAKRTSYVQDWGEEGGDEVPSHYFIQVQQQMHVFNLDRIWMPVLMFTGWQEEWRLYCVRRDDHLIEEMCAFLVGWWSRHIEARVPPADEPAPMEILQRLRRGPASSIVLGDESLEVIAKWEAAKLRLKGAGVEAEQAKHRVLALLGDDNPVEEGLLPDGRRLCYRPQKSTPSVDHTRFRADHPELYDEYVTRGEHRVLRIQKGKNDGE